MHSSQDWLQHFQFIPFAVIPPLFGNYFAFFSIQFDPARQLPFCQNIFLRSMGSSVIFLVTPTITCRLFFFMGGPSLDFVFSLFPTSYLLHHFGVFIWEPLFISNKLLYYSAGWYIGFIEFIFLTARPGFQVRPGSSSRKSFAEPVPLTEKGQLPDSFIPEDPDSHYIYICSKLPQGLIQPLVQ